LAIASSAIFLLFGYSTFVSISGDQKASSAHLSQASFEDPGFGCGKYVLLRLPEGF
jgi:hypothetical protein